MEDLKIPQLPPQRKGSTDTASSLHHAHSSSAFPGYHGLQIALSSGIAPHNCSPAADSRGPQVARKEMPCQRSQAEKRSCCLPLSSSLQPRFPHLHLLHSTARLKGGTRPPLLPQCCKFATTAIQGGTQGNQLVNTQE